MTSCKYPQHHQSGDCGSVGQAAAAAAGVIVAFVVAAKVLAFVGAYWPVIVAAVAVGLGLAVAVAAVRFARLDPAARRYWLSARWHRVRWRRLARNLQLARQDKHRGG